MCFEDVIIEISNLSAQYTKYATELDSGLNMGKRIVISSVFKLGWPVHTEKVVKNRWKIKCQRNSFRKLGNKALKFEFIAVSR